MSTMESSISHLDRGQAFNFLLILLGMLVTDSLQVIIFYWRSRLKRIVPAYYMTMAANLISPILLGMGRQTHEARQLALNLRGPGIR